MRLTQVLETSEESLGVQWEPLEPQTQAEYCPQSPLLPPSLESHSTPRSSTGTLITSQSDLPQSPLNLPFLLRMLSITPRALKGNPNSIVDLQDQHLDLKYLLSLDSHHTTLSAP